MIDIPPPVLPPLLHNPSRPAPDDDPALVTLANDSALTRLKAFLEEICIANPTSENLSTETLPASNSASENLPAPNPALLENRNHDSDQPITFKEGQTLRHEPLTDVAYQIQRETQEHQAGQRAAMKKRHDRSKNVVIFKDGDFATVAIPANDRTPLDARRLTVKVIGVPKDDVYKLQCRHGILDRAIGISSLNAVHDDIIRRIREDIDNAPTNKISLHAAARLESPSDRVAINCNCRKSCTTNKCTCHKNGKKCGQNCHGDDTDCGNIAEKIIDRIDKSIVIDSDTESASSLAPSRKRAATLSNPKQPRKLTKMTKKQASPPLSPLLPTDDPLSATDAFRAGPPRRRKTTQLARESREQLEEGRRGGKKKGKGKEKEQLTLSQFDQTQGVVRRLEGMTKV